MNLKIGILLFCGILKTIKADSDSKNDSVNSPYLELILCPIRNEFWECATKQTRRLLDTWNSEVFTEWQKLKADGDKELKTKLESRGFSEFENVKEKPSTILSKIEIGANYVQDFINSTLNRIYGIEESNNDLIEKETENEERSLSEQNGTDTRQLRKKPQMHAGLAHLGQAIDFLSGHGIKHGIKFPHKYGRSIGVQRGKKKKKKQLLMKFMLLATLIKGKIELLLKIFSAHLQVKFFLIALVGLVINVARFWLDFRRGVVPQKVIYYEHSHHQHHYDEHGGGGDWGGGEEGGGGGYWKRSLQSTQESGHNNNQPESYSDVSYGYNNNNNGNDDMYTHRMAYSRQIPRIIN